jgi:hypothetical protein
LTEAEKLKRDIDAVKESIRLEWLALAERPMSPLERQNVRQSIAALIETLQELLERLDRENAHRT